MDVTTLSTFLRLYCFFSMTYWGTGDIYAKNILLGVLKTSYILLFFVTLKLVMKNIIGLIIIWRG